MMIKALKNAVREVEELSEADKEELAKALLDPRVRKRIDAMLAEAEARGGATPHEKVFAALKARYVG